MTIVCQFNCNIKLYYCNRIELLSFLSTICAVITQKASRKAQNEYIHKKYILSKKDKNKTKLTKMIVVKSHSTQYAFATRRKIIIIIHVIIISFTFLSFSVFCTHLSNEKYIFRAGIHPLRYFSCNGSYN